MSNTAQHTYALGFDNLELSNPDSIDGNFTIFGIRGSALVEAICFLSLAVMLNIVFSDGMRFSGYALHPFWVIVLLVTVQYGLKEALMAAALSSAFLLAWNMPDQTMSESFYDFVLRAFSQPLLWFLAALVLGGIRERQISEKNNLSESLNNLEEATSIVVDGYNALKDAKEKLETRLSEERCGLVTAYDLAMSLDTVDSASLKAAVEKLVRTTLNPAKFSFFKCSDGALRLQAAFGWKDGNDFATHFDKDSPIARSIVKRKRILSIADTQDGQILGVEGQLAGPVFDKKTGKLYGMLKIEEADFLHLGNRTHEIFNIVCSWVARSATNIESFRKLPEKNDPPVSSVSENYEEMVHIQTTGRQDIAAHNPA